MKSLTIMAALFLMLIASHNVYATTDGIYGLKKDIISSWDGADSGLIADTSSEYDYIYGDDASLIYQLPQTWPTFSFYGQAYNHITVDTNGNIWFGPAESVNSFTLRTTGPVIAAWNNDLTSYFNGGVFVQHKTDLPQGDRVVIEWQVESYTDQGLGLPNNFEVVLFKNGNIRIDYRSFATANNKDSGSGISSNDNTHYLSITSVFFPVYLLFGNSYSFTPSGPTLQVNFIGTGSGQVISSPEGIACNADCSASFPSGEIITLTPSPSQYSQFDGWSNGICSGLGVCQFTLNSDTSISATFNKDTEHQVNVGGTYYNNIQAAYDSAIDGSIIKLWGTTYNESLICNRNITVTLQGGFDSGYTTQNGMTYLQGTLDISDGKVITDKITLKQ